MKDFRPRLVARLPGPGLIQELLRQGKLQKAIRKARALGMTLPQTEIDAAARVMVRNHRAGELLSYIGVLEIKLPYDVATLLRKAFEAKDYHTFLKQAHRLHVKAGFETEIDLAIRAIELRTKTEAAAWLRKFLLP